MRRWALAPSLNHRTQSNQEIGHPRLAKSTAAADGEQRPLNDTMIMRANRTPQQRAPNAESACSNSSGTIHDQARTTRQGRSYGYHGQQRPSYLKRSDGGRSGQEGRRGKELEFSLRSYRRCSGSVLMRAISLRATMATAASSGGATINVLNPATRQILASLSATTPDAVDTTIRAAKEAFDSGIWSRAPAHHRAKVLSRLSASLADRVPELAILESQQTGRTLREFRAQLGPSAHCSWVLVRYS